MSFILVFILACVYLISCTLLHFRKNPQEDSLEEMTKKGKVATSEKSEMIPLFSDTMYSRDGATSTWEVMYYLLEEEKPRPLLAKATFDAHVSSNASYFEIACSFLHRIAARPKIITYTYMVKWIIDMVDVSDREFNNNR